MKHGIAMGSRPKTDGKLISQFNGLNTSTVAAVLDEMEVGGIMLTLKPVIPTMRFLGAALTVKEHTAEKGTYSPLEFAIGTVIELTGENDVIVIENGGKNVSTWGGRASHFALAKGVKGLVVEGGVRDADEIIELGFPVFPRHVVPLSGKTRIKVVEINTEVVVDNVAVRPGDILLGDATGVVCVPYEHAAEVARKSREIHDRDQALMRNKGFEVT